MVHWVGNAGSSAMGNRNYFESCKSKRIYASAQYIIGLSGEIIRCIPENEVAYHAGNLTINRNSIGIECCHPDWSGKFNSATYNSLVELCVDLCRRYGLTANSIIRHYDVTRKECPKYYVKNPESWINFKNEVARKLGQAGQSIVQVVEKGEDVEVRRYENGSSKEIVYSDTDCKLKLGSLSAYEKCDCLGVFNNKAMVRYQVGSTGNYKIGFVKWLRWGKIKILGRSRPYFFDVELTFFFLTISNIHSISTQSLSSILSRSVSKFSHSGQEKLIYPSLV